MATNYGSDSGAAAATPAVPGNLAAMLCYFPLLAVLFLLLAPYNKDKTVRFHAFQCFGLVACMIVLEIALSIVTAVLAAVSPALASTVALVLNVIALGGLVLFVVCMVKAYRGERLSIPFVTPLAEKYA